ncbi:ABC transporter ATP-binding protein [Flammeovirga kamogawensis]|uniref:ABC transporter ATP-binding protein/permease n=1 Tax=Flammeovirga kamogawensis TaxID=373891 RepID=A0ABX8GSU5_9BACT|nr:ABC transporter ATP-binding protein [Flammeovirga kamogawensis]MBB6462944.1 subfamily B ATP-binding cassette protein MsbA [Flammeovirga kamogawensis]QWG06471.1 ABC transporter ATP-binding protein/permease [Flammeovirga kamogawensis]TRX68300.1 ABC transporter ATP-binding protein [Flammeovirga kamogawensis]
MKIYKRLLTFTGNLPSFLVPYFFVTLFMSVFSLLNFTMMIPLLDILFNSDTSFQIPDKLLTLNDFHFNMDFIKEYAYQEFGILMLEKGKLSALMLICLFTFLASLFTNIFRYIERRLAENYRRTTIASLRTSVFQRVLSLDIGYLTNSRKSDIMARSTTDVTESENAFGALVTFIKDPIMLVIFFSTLIYISPKMTMFVFLILPVSGISIGLIAKKLKQVSHNLQDISGSLLGVLDETIVGMRVVKGFNADKYVSSSFEKYNQGYVKAFRDFASKRELASPLSEVLGVFFVGVLLYLGGTIVLSEDATLTAAEFMAYLVLFTQVLNPVKAISGNLSSIQRGMAATERIFELLDTEPKIKDKSDAKSLNKFDKGIEFKGVSFGYEDKDVLKDINFKLEKGKMLALVGPSGGGKSTLADLIPRFYDPRSGKIEIDGHDVKDYTLSSLRSHMGIVTQESILFNDTIYNNIAFGTETTLEEVEKAAKIANAHEFIIKTEEGYNSVIGDRGSKLSGGQKQRLSIARAILKNPDILILDEATSALDTESEKLVQDAIQHLMKGRTVLVIAHRLSTIQEADKILVIKEGQVVEEGTHVDLMAVENGMYKRLQEMQEYSK